MEYINNQLCKRYLKMRGGGNIINFNEKGLNLIVDNNQDIIEKILSSSDEITPEGIGKLIDHAKNIYDEIINNNKLTNNELKKNIEDKIESPVETIPVISNTSFNKEFSELSKLLIEKKGEFNDRLKKLTEEIKIDNITKIIVDLKEDETLEEKIREVKEKIEDEWEKSLNNLIEAELKEEQKELIERKKKEIEEINKIINYLKEDEMLEGGSNFINEIRKHVDMKKKKADKNVKKFIDYIDINDGYHEKTISNFHGKTLELKKKIENLTKLNVYRETIFYIIFLINEKLDDNQKKKLKIILSKPHNEKTFIEVNRFKLEELKKLNAYNYIINFTLKLCDFLDHNNEVKDINFLKNYLKTIIFFLHEKSNK